MVTPVAERTGKPAPPPSGDTGEYYGRPKQATAVGLSLALAKRRTQLAASSSRNERRAGRRSSQARTAQGCSLVHYL